MNLDIFAGQLYREELGRVRSISKYLQALQILNPETLKTKPLFLFRSIVKDVILSDHVLTKEEIDAAVPDGDVNMKKSLESLGNPLSQMEKLRHYMNEHVASLRRLGKSRV